jgi:hypothetical protein
MGELTPAFATPESSHDLHARVMPCIKIVTSGNRVVFRRFGFEYGKWET